MKICQKLLLNDNSETLFHDIVHNVTDMSAIWVGGNAAWRRLK